MQRDNYSDDDIRSVLAMKNIAVVGMSREPSKDAHIVPKYLMDKGYNVIPVNPYADKILGKKVYKSLKDINEQIDIVDVFRPSEQVYDVVREVIERGNIKVIWLQLGIYNNEAIEEAERHGIKVVYNRCIMQEHKRLFG